MASTLIRFLRAFAWLRWRLVVAALRGGRRRDALEQFARVSALAVPLMLVVLVGSFALVLGVLGFFGGTGMGSGSMRAIRVMAAPRVLLFLLMMCMIVIPSGTTTVAGHARFLLLPIPRRALHLLELLTSIAGPWIAPLLPGLALIATGLFVSGRGDAALVALVAALAITVCMAALNTAVASFTNWILRNRRRSEISALLGVLVFTFAAVVPAVASKTFGKRVKIGVESGQLVEGFDRELPEWSRALPTELYGRSIEHAVEGRDATAWFSVALLALEALALYALSSLLHHKLVESSESSRGRSRAVPIRTSTFRIPGLTASVSAIAIVQARTALRSVRGRIAVMLPAAVVAVLAVAARYAPGELPAGASLNAHGPLLFGCGIVFSMFSLLAFTMNQFATDRAGVARWILAPISEVELVHGKAVGCALILAIPVTASLVVATIMSPSGTWIDWISVLLGGAATYLLMSPVAAVMSALFPVAADLSKSGSGGNPHGLALFTGMMVVGTLSSIPAAIVAIVDHRMHQPLWALALVAAWTAIAVAIAVPTLKMAAGAVASRRESLVLAARER